MGPTSLLPLRRKACWGIFRPKNPTASSGCEPANLGYSITPLGQRAADFLASSPYFQPQNGNRKFSKSRVHVPFPCRNLDPLSQQKSEFQDDYRLQAWNTRKNIAKNLKKTQMQTHLTGLCKLSSAFRTWLPCETSVSHRIISPSLLHTLRPMRVDGPAPCVEMHGFVFNIWKPKILGGERSKGWKTLPAHPPFQWINKSWSI
jgi:hypothetical protein